MSKKSKQQKLVDINEIDQVLRALEINSSSRGFGPNGEDEDIGDFLSISIPLVYLKKDWN